MWRRRQIDLLTDQNVELSDGVPDTFELWQVRMEIECANALKKAETIKRSFDFNRRWRPVGLGRRMKPVAVLDRDAQPREERACEPAEHLLRRYGFIAVVEKIRESTAKKLAMGKVWDIANVVMRAPQRPDDRTARGIFARLRLHLSRLPGRCGKSQN